MSGVVVQAVKIIREIMHSRSGNVAGHDAGAY